MRIIIFEVEEWERGSFDSLKESHDVQLLENKLTLENAGQYADAEIISTFIYSNLNREVLEQFQDLKLIATRSTGYDHISLDCCEDQDITVCNVPEYGDNTVAEHVFGLLLALSHNLVEAVDRTRRGDFSLRGLKGFDLRGKTLGVIGTGSIGQYVIQIAHGFSMEIIAYDVYPDQELAERLDFTYLGMEEVLSKADILTLHVPANEKTHHLISDREFRKMKEGVVVINTSRGSILDIEALSRALGDGKVAAAGLDVLPEEPTIREESELLRSFYHEEYNLRTLLAGHVLLRLRRVIITPHSAFYTKEALQRIVVTTIENIHAYVAGKPINVVSED